MMEIEMVAAIRGDSPPVQPAVPFTRSTGCFFASAPDSRHGPWPGPLGSQRWAEAIHRPLEGAVAR